jgi:hypothetical protein
MDPYLEDERVWPTFQHQLVNCLYQMLLPGLVDRYRARVTQRHYTDESAVPRYEDRIEIRQRSDGRLVTLLDVVSPCNKTTAAGRQAYIDNRREGRSANANLVEIDLVLQGQPMLEYSREGLPEWDYAVTVTRATQPDRHEVYTSTLQKPLPRFRLPLAADDRDTVLNLHAAFTRAFDQGDFDGQIDYRREPPGPVSEKYRPLMETLLREVRERQPAGFPDEAASQEAVARAAYFIWLKEGCPQGRDQEHWLRAEEQVQRERQA